VPETFWNKLKKWPTAPLQRVQKPSVARDAPTAALSSGSTRRLPDLVRERRRIEGVVKGRSHPSRPVRLLNEPYAFDKAAVSGAWPATARALDGVNKLARCGNTAPSTFQR
jgi:hypothetical protein